MKVPTASDEELSRTLEILPDQATAEVNKIWETVGGELERPLTTNEKLFLIDILITTTAVIHQAPQLVSSMRVLMTSAARIMAYPAMEQTMAKDIPDKFPDF